MRIEIDTEKLEDADEFGEILREYCFKKKKGCYTCFGLVAGFRAVPKDSEQGRTLLDKLGYSRESLLSTLRAYSSREEYKRQAIMDFKDMYERSVLASNGVIAVAWYWDGDGTLLFQDESRAAINTDCKKDYGWEWLPPER